MIDWTRIGELRDEVGEEDFAEVVALFLAEAAEVVDRLREGADPATLGADLHFLKGSALTLGFAAFAERCQAGEAAVRTGGGAAVDLPAILAEFDASVALFRQRLAA